VSLRVGTCFLAGCCGLEECYQIMHLVLRNTSMRVIKRSNRKACLSGEKTPFSSVPFVFMASYYCREGILYGGRGKARCAFFDRNFHSRMPLVPRLLASSEQACDQRHSSRVSAPLTGWHCKLRPNIEGRDLCSHLSSLSYQFTL
jgi:hypothetical protein